MTKYSVFISFKNTFDGKPTVDSEIAEKIYDKLMKRGVDTFYSNDTIKSLGVSEYKQAINDALDSSAVLILIGSRLEFIKKDTAQWVHYEWNSFHSECMYSNGDKILVPYLSANISRRDKPFELREIQTFTLENDSIDDMVEFVVNFLKTQQRDEENAAIAQPITSKSTKQKASNPLQRFKMANWINLSTLAFLILACCITLIVSSGLPNAFLAETWFMTVMIFLLACYPCACVLIHFARKLKLLPKALLGIFITLMCLPAVGVILLVVKTYNDWNVILAMVALIGAPTVGIILSIAYSIVVICKVPKLDKFSQLD